MNSSTNLHQLDVKSVPSEIDAISTMVRATAERSQGDAIALLALLRTLEELHRYVCDRHFQAALPNNRQALYALLRDIESQGGWPYIPRMKLQNLLESHREDNSLEEGSSR